MFKYLEIMLLENLNYNACQWHLSGSLLKSKESNFHPTLRTITHLYGSRTYAMQLRVTYYYSLKLDIFILVAVYANNVCEFMLNQIQIMVQLLS